MCFGPELLIFEAATAAEIGGAALGAAEFGGAALGLGEITGASIGLAEAGAGFGAGLGSFGGAELFGAGLGGLEGAGGFAAGLGGFGEALGGFGDAAGSFNSPFNFGGGGLEGSGGFGGGENLFGTGIEGSGGTFGGDPGLGAGVSTGLDAGAGTNAFTSGLQAESIMEGLGAGGSASLGAGSSSPNFLSQAFGAFQKYGQPALSAYSGINGLIRAKQMREMAKMAAKRADPWGTSGGRALADSQLQELMRDPTGAASRDPAFALRIQGAQRANAQYGQDSGAMSVAGANASTSWYNERLAQLGGMAGAGINPGTGAQIGLQGYGQAAELESAGLGSLGYAAAGLAGRGGLTPQQQQQLLLLALGRGG